MRKILYTLIFFGIAFLVLFLTFYPNYYALVKTPLGFFYSGQASWFDPWDINVYVAAIKWGQQGHLLLSNLYTTDIGWSVLFYPVYTVIGFLFQNINPFLLFNLLAIFSGAILIFGVFYLSRVFLQKTNEALIALFLIALGGGFGFASTNITSFTFHSAFQRAHEGLGTLLYLSSLIFCFLAIKKSKNLYYYLTLLFLIILIVFYPYYLLSFALICGIFAGFRHLNLLKITLICLVTGVFAIIYLLHLKSSGFSTVAAQSLSNPGLISMTLGYGLFLPIFVYQLFILKKKDDTRLFLTIWFLVSLSLSFLPLGFARFYLRGLFFPLGILMMMTLPYISRRLSLQKNGLIFLLVILTPLTSFYIFAKRVEEVDKNNPWFYQSVAVKNAFRFLEKQKQNGVLASYVLGNYIPAHTGKSVYFGHLIQTPQAQEKLNNLTNFYAGKFMENQALQFLKDNKIHFVVYGNDEKKLGELKYPFLKPVFQSEGIEIFKVD